MATNPVSSTQANGLYDLYKSSLQTRTDQADAEQRQAKEAAAKAETVQANRIEEQRRVDQQSTTTKPQSTNLRGEVMGTLLSVKA